jgi:outer membrane murein-binding lipoprotein Lpp
VQIAQAFTACTDTQTVEETMTKPLTQIGNEVREMTDAEYAQWQADAAVAAAQEQAAADAAARTRERTCETESPRPYRR